MKIVIPARYASTRLPGKPLADIAGRPMIRHVWDRALEATGRPTDIWVATDDQRVADAVAGFGGQVVLTRDDHPSGTDRIAEVAGAQGWSDEEIVVNVQGDEPLIPPSLISLVGQGLADHPAASLATASHAITEVEDLINPNVVKVVTDATGFAGYFSRAAIPHQRGADVPDVAAYPYQRHIGIYAYRVATLKALTALPPAPTELVESLEQLRALWNGMKILVLSVPEAPPRGVDTQGDLDAVRHLMAGG